MKYTGKWWDNPDRSDQERPVAQAVARSLIFIVALVLTLILLTGCSTQQEPIPTQFREKIDLSQLDSIPCIYYWEVREGKLQIWTVEDEVENELERLRYIQENFYE